MTVPVWFQITQAVALVAVASFGVWVAFQQWRTAKEKIRLDLFEKRWEVFDLAQHFCGKVLKNFDPAFEDFRLSWKARNKAVFLFENDVNHHLKVIHDKAARLHYLATSIANQNHPNRSNLIEENQALTVEFSEISEKLHEKFQRYMKFTNAGQQDN